MTPADATPEMIEQMRADNAMFPSKLQEIPKEGWPTRAPGLFKVFRSNRFLVQVYRFKTLNENMVRLSINRTEVVGKRWEQGITWDELQRLKSEAGYGEFDAVEIYPADKDVVNVANLRHLWVFLDKKIEFAWRKGEA